MSSDSTTGAPFAEHRQSIFGGVYRLLSKIDRTRLTAAYWVADEVDDQYLLIEFLNRATGEQAESNTPEAWKSSDGPSLSDFLKIVEQLSRLRHPNIEPILQFFEDNGTGYAVVQSRIAKSLADEIDRNAFFHQPAEVLSASQDLVEAVAYCTALRIQEVEITPDAVSIDDDGNPMISIRHLLEDMLEVKVDGQIPDLAYGASQCIYAMMTGVIPEARHVRKHMVASGQADPVFQTVDLDLPYPSSVRKSVDIGLAGEGMDPAAVLAWTRQFGLDEQPKASVPPPVKPKRKLGGGFVGALAGAAALTAAVFAFVEYKDDLLASPDADKPTPSVEVSIPQTSQEIETAAVTPSTQTEPEAPVIAETDAAAPQITEETETPELEVAAAPVVETPTAPATLEAPDEPDAEVTTGAEAPANEPSEAPAAEVSEAPASEVSEAPASEVSETPAAEVSEAPANEVSATPANEPSEAPATEVSEAPVNEPSETPATEVSEAPATEVSETPANETSETPANETSETPATEVTATPVEPDSTTADATDDADEQSAARRPVSAADLEAVLRDLADGSAAAPSAPASVDDTTPSATADQQGEEAQAPAETPSATPQLEQADEDVAVAAPSSNDQTDVTDKPADAVTPTRTSPVQELETFSTNAASGVTWRVADRIGHEVVLQDGEDAFLRLSSLENHFSFVTKNPWYARNSEIRNFGDQKVDEEFSLQEALSSYFANEEQASPLVDVMVSYDGSATEAAKVDLPVEALRSFGPIRVAQRNVGGKWKLVVDQVSSSTTGLLADDEILSVLDAESSLKTISQLVSIIETEKTRGKSGIDFSVRRGVDSVVVVSVGLDDL